MTADGTWTLTMQTPLGERQASITLASDGGKLTGSQSAEGQTGDIYDGSVSGNEVAWKVDITNPLPMTLEFNGAIDGDSMSGMMAAGMYGSWSFTGMRA